MTVKNEKGKYTVISDDHTFLVVLQPRPVAAKILREHVSAVRADAILNQEPPTEAVWRKEFLAAAAKVSKGAKA